MRLGSDLVYVPRIARLWQALGERFLDKLYTPTEQADCLRTPDPQRVAHHLAGRWAVKESVVKALGCGWRGVGYREVEVLRAPSGAPSILLHGRALTLTLPYTQGVDWQVSLSHDQDYAFATVLMLCRD
jgi:holo-[acyl-carrier protein] synthase